MTPDARLSPAELAALAHLEARASSDDPHLARRLRGQPERRRLPDMVGRCMRAWATLVGTGWWGVPLVVAGLALMAAGLASVLAVSLIGVIACAVGLRMVAGLVERRGGATRSADPNS
jgi:hypothetical protein